MAPHRWLTGSRARDLVVVAVVLLVDAWSGLVVVTTEQGGELGGPAPVRVALAVPLALPLLWRRSRPGTVLLAVAGVQAAAAATGLLVSAVSASLAVAVVSAAIHLPVRRGLLTVLVAVTLVVAGDEIGGPGGIWVLWTILAPFLLLVGWAVGRARADRARTDLEMEVARRDSQVAERIVEERTRIARELHDVVSHALSAITIQSAVARDRLRADPDAADAALTEVEGLSRRALAEMRVMLGVLRAPATDPGDGAVVGIDAIADLVDGVRRTGRDVRVRVEIPDLPSVPASASAAAYRLVQEGLTNVMRHSAARRVDVVLTVSGARLTVEVADDGAAAAVQPSWEGAGGLGLIGLRERVHVLGGSLEAGPVHGGWRIRAELPLDPVIHPVPS